MIEQWMNYLTTQWWIYTIIGVMAFLGYLIRGLTDQKAIQLLSKSEFAAGSALLSLYASQVVASNPWWGLVLGGGAMFAILAWFIPESMRLSLVKSENFGKLVIAVLAMAGFIMFVVPTLTLQQLVNICVGFVLVGIVYLVALSKKKGDHSTHNQAQSQSNP